MYTVLICFRPPWGRNYARITTPSACARLPNSNLLAAPRLRVPVIPAPSQVSRSICASRLRHPISAFFHVPSTCPIPSTIIPGEHTVETRTKHAAQTQGDTSFWGSIVGFLLHMPTRNSLHVPLQPFHLVVPSQPRVCASYFSIFHLGPVYAFHTHRSICARPVCVCPISTPPSARPIHASCLLRVPPPRPICTSRLSAAIYSLHLQSCGIARQE